MSRANLIESFVNSLPSKEIDEWLRLRKASDASKFFFVKYIGGSVQKAGGDLSEWLHKPIMDSWQNPDQPRQGATMPRGWRKTTGLTVLGNLWEYLQNNEIRILLPSEKMDTAAKWIQQISNHVVRNARLRWQYPELGAVDDDWIRGHRWSSLYLEFPREGFYPEPTIECVGIKGAAQGGHYDLVAPDDLVGEKGMESPLVLEDALRWFDNIEELLIQPSRGQKDSSRIRVLGTCWGPGDYIEYIQDKYPEYLWHMVSALKHEEKSRRENVIYLNNPTVGIGESNFTEGGTTEHYIEMQANPDKEMVFWAQHMNMPTGASKTTKFDLAWLGYYHIESRDETDIVVCDDGEEFPLKSITKYGLIDPGGFADTKMMKGSSRNALFIAGQPDISSRKFVFATSAGRFKSPKEFMDIFFGLHLKWGVRLWKIEVIAAQKYIYKDILEEKRKRGITVSIVPMAPDVGKGAKDARIISLIDPCSRGEYFVHRSMKDLLGEYKSYPSGITKDLIDMWGVYNRDFSRRRPPADTMQMKEQELFYIPDAIVPDIPSDRGVTGYGVSWE